MAYPVVDTHVHIGMNPLINWTTSDLAQWMDEGGIDIQIAFQVNEQFVHRTPDWNPYLGNDWIARLQRELPGRVLGLGTVNPWHQPPRGRGSGRNACLEELDRCMLDLGLWGLKMHPLETHYQINNPYVVNPIMERLVELQRQVGRKLVLVVHAAGDTLNNSPEALADIARQFPDLLFLAAHAGYKWAWPTLLHMLGPCKNVLLDLTTMAAPGCVAPVYDLYGAGKFTAGSDGPYATVRVKNAIVKAVAHSPEDEELILGGTLARLLDLPKALQA